MIEKIESGDRPITYSRVSLSRGPRGLPEIPRDIRTSINQICRTEENQVERQHFTNEYRLLKLENIETICGKEDK